MHTQEQLPYLTVLPPYAKIMDYICRAEQLLSHKGIGVEGASPLEVVRVCLTGLLGCCMQVEMVFNCRVKDSALAVPCQGRGC